MVYAIVSDIHANLEAFDAVREAIGRDSVDASVSLGDIVGYGADPVATIDGIRDLGPVVSVAGNHDYGVAGLTDIGSFNEHARRGVEWTRSVLDQARRAYLSSMELVRTHAGMTFVHGSLDDPAAFNYILSAHDARSTIEAMSTQIVFVGHSHYAGIYRGRGGRVTRVGCGQVAIEDGFRYVVNAGSVGQPRDGDPRAAYVVYDDRRRVVEVRRVPYDIRAAQQKILDAGLPAALAERLREGV